MKLALIYTLFALVATVVNIASQDVSIRVYQGQYALFISVLVGTATGLVTKYVLDKKYIFQYQTRSAAHDIRTFSGYTAMGMGTTAIFWAFEFSFDALFNTREMRYLGAVIGLAIGYYLKYQLDKRFVFVG